MDNQEKSRRIAQHVYGAHVLDAHLSEPVEIGLRVAPMVHSVGSSITWYSSPLGLQEVEVSKDWAPYQAFVGFLPLDQLLPETVSEGSRYTRNFPILYPPFPGAQLIRTQREADGSSIQDWVCMGDATTRCIRDWGMWGFALWRLALLPAGWTLEKLREYTANLSLDWSPPDYYLDAGAGQQLLAAVGKFERPMLIERAKRQWMENGTDRFSVDHAIFDLLASPDPLTLDRDREPS